MDWKELLGVLGFVLSLLVFIVTRWERRKTLSIDIECVHLPDSKYSEKFKENLVEGEAETLILIRVMNTGARSIVIDKNSIKVIGNNGVVDLIEYGADGVGFEGIPHPLNPGERFEVGCFLGSFTFSQGCNKYSKDIIPITVEIMDIENKRYRAKSKYELLLEVGEIERVK